MGTSKHYVGGRWQLSTHPDPIVVRSPHDQSLVAEAPQASLSDIDQAVFLAAESFRDGRWSARSPVDRLDALSGLLERYRAHEDEMAALITSENGSPISFSQFAQVGGAIGVLEGALVAASQYEWEQEMEGAFTTSRIWHEPVGVVAAITAWNVPQILILAKLIPALLAGCSVVVKASAEAPLDALLLAQIIDELDLPTGVVSILAGGGEAGRHLVSHPDVDKVAFTGSSAVGREVGSICGQQLKRMSLELGGKSAAIVLEDADLERTAAGLRFVSFMNNGQACAAQTRVLAPRSRYDEMVSALQAAMASFVVGDPADPATEIGPLVSRRQHERVLGYIDQGRHAGARLVTGGVAGSGDLASGNYVEPTLFADVDNSMSIAQEEIFGPVLVVIPYDDTDDAVRIANDSLYGLGGSVWTKDRSQGLALARRVRTGMFGVNTFGPDTRAPFGGFKASGIGREYGVAGLEAFLETKAVHGA